MSARYQNAIIPAAGRDAEFRPEVVFDRFHVCQLASRAVDDVRRVEWSEHDMSQTKSRR